MPETSFLKAVESVENDGCEGPVKTLADIKSAMFFLLKEAEKRIPEGLAKKRAECYWLSQIKISLLNRGVRDYYGGVTMEDTIEEIKEQIQELWED